MPIKHYKQELIVVTKHISNGGSERVLTELMSYWVKIGVKVSLVILRPDLCSDDYIIDKEIELIKLPKNHILPRRTFATIFLIKLLRKRKNSRVLSFVTPAQLICGFVSFFVNNKFIFSERNDPNQTPVGLYRRIIRDIIFTRAYKCVFQTQQAKEHFYNSIQKRSYVILNPINPNIPQPYKGKRRKVIVAIGRLNLQKNFHLLINAFKLFHDEYPDYKLEIFGRGELEEELKLLINKLNLTDSVLLKGFFINIYDKIKDCAMYVSSSNFEGISNSMLEALALGLPTICTDCPVGGARIIIKHNINGILTPVGDVQLLYESMKKIVYNNDFANFISKNAINVRHDYSIDKIAKQWLNILF